MSCLFFQRGHDVVDRLKTDIYLAAIARPVRPERERLQREQESLPARVAPDCGHVGAELGGVGAAAARAVEEPILLNVAAAANVT